MKPTELQIDAVSEAVRHLTAGHHYAEAFINQWEAIRPPDPVLTFLRDDLDKHRDAYSNLLRNYHALQDSCSKLTASDPPPTFGDPPHGWEWHNPDGFTPERVNIADGWRLLCKGEQKSATDYFYNSDYDQWRPVNSAGDPCAFITYRTKAPLPDPKPTKEEIERAAFQAWWIETDIEGDYKDFAFAAWKAARNQTQQP